MSRRTVIGQIQEVVGETKEEVKSDQLSESFGRTRLVRRTLKSEEPHQFQIMVVTIPLK